ncbi:CHAT domain-containing protein [Microcoleus sp. FACHB-831]|uniref:WD40 domain-containing protein n=1 Tax=Microcoleus sp. FACHB-831 TaxID=2692827 RepID=UPI0016844B2F|nr:CHAT domain-containing protein [Microcoleus sp. FACHB-831]MBD1921125.1 CHAT domain-containing protein [Microcoleus sp. FACHB-831]
MTKLLFLNINNGCFNYGFSVNLRYPSGEVNGNLPPAPHIPELYDSWKLKYLHLELCFREQAKRQRTGRRIPDVGRLRDECHELFEQFRENIKDWLKKSDHSRFQEIRERLREELRDSRERQEEVRVLIKTEDDLLRRLPWSEWDLFDKYTKVEIALIPCNYEQVYISKRLVSKTEVRLLAILGNSDGIEVEADRNFLNSLPTGIPPLFLPQPTRPEVSDRLWEQDWDILFFAGHSSREGESGIISINKTEKLTITNLKNGLRKAIEHGLQLAIFNSCDGLKLAEDLADLNIPQVIVMREPVPDRVAQKFLKYFLTAFSSGESLYLAVRNAKKRLGDEGCDNEFPGAAGLATIWQNPTVVPLSWLEMGGRENRTPSLADGTWRCVHTLTGHSKSVMSVAISPDSQTLASGSADATIKLWRLDTGELLYTLTGHSGSVRSLAFSQEAGAGTSPPLLASGSEDKTIKVWRLPTGELLRALAQDSDSVLSVAIGGSDGRTLASGTMDGTIKLWDLGSGQLLYNFRGHFVYPVSCVAISPDGGAGADGPLLASGAQDNTIKIWNLRTRQEIRTLNGSSGWFNPAQYWVNTWVGGFNAVAFSPDGEILASGDEEKKIKLWRSDTGELLRTLTGHSGGVECVAFSPDNQTLASGGSDNTIRIWKWRTGQMLQTLGHSNKVYAIAFSPDGQTLVSGSADMTVKIWRVSS